MTDRREDIRNIANTWDHGKPRRWTECSARTEFSGKRAGGESAGFKRSRKRARNHYLRKYRGNYKGTKINIVDNRHADFGVKWNGPVVDGVLPLVDAFDGRCRKQGLF